MTRTMRPQDLIDSTVVDPEGSKIGKVGTVYLADDTRTPEWVTVKTGLFGHKESFVPLKGADIDEDGLHVSVPKDKVSDAPRFETDGHLSQGDSAELYRHYGLPMPRSAPDNKNTGRHAGGDQSAGQMAAGQPAAGQKTGRADKNMGTKAAGGEQMRGGKQAAGRQDQGMTRSEERLNVGTEQVESGRVRLHKYVVTEEQQITVPVRHEEVRVVREPITDGARGTGHAEIGEQDQEVILHSEKPVVNKETVEMERVRLGTETVTEEETISGKIRKEQIEVTDDSKHRKA